METAIYISSLIVIFVISLASLYLRSYIKHKANTLATNENFTTLRKQLEVTTDLTKAIEHRISNNAWVEQQRWAIRKEFYLSAVPSLNMLNVDLSLLIDNHIAGYSEGDDDKYNRLQEENDILNRSIDEESRKLRELTHNIGVLFLDSETIDAINIYLQAEEIRVKPLKYMLDKADGYNESMEIQAEIQDYNMYISTQADSCEKAKNGLIEAAKEDLKIAWSK